MPNPAADFRAFEARMGLSRVADTAAMLGISRQSAHDLRTGKTRQPHPSTRRLMTVLLWCRERGELPPISA